MGTEDKRVGRANERAVCPKGVKDTVLEGRDCYPRFFLLLAQFREGWHPKTGGQSVLSL